MCSLTDYRTCSLQLKAVRTFYKQNGYIEFSTAEKMLIKNPKAFLTKEFGDEAFALRSCVFFFSFVPVWCCSLFCPIYRSLFAYI